MEELRDFTYLSNVHIYIDKYKENGHKMGRKVGDMLEILTMGKIYKDDSLKNHLVIEPKLIGASTAGHKVEFAFIEPTSKKTIGFIECKKVGVEVTTNSSTRNNNIKISLKERKLIMFNNEWLEYPIKVIMIPNKINDIYILEFFQGDIKESKIISFPITENDTFKIFITEKNNLYISSPNSKWYKEKYNNEKIRICRTYKVEKINDSSVEFKIFDHLTGPQTIEKAKQAAFVALDVRKKETSSTEITTITSKIFSSILVIGEFSHWENKSINVVKTYMDHILIVPDYVIIAAFEALEKKFDRSLVEILDLISKNSFKTNNIVQEIIYEVIDSFNGNVLYDFFERKFVNLKILNNSLIVY